MIDNALRAILSERLAEVPLFDVHTHLVTGKLGARGLHDILLYHMAISDLYAAGCPSGARLTQYPGWSTLEEAHSRIREALPYLQYVQNTSITWGIKTILRDLYDVNEPVTADNWKRIDSIIRERSEDRTWHREIARKANIQHFVTESARRESNIDDDIFSYSLEWAFFTRCQWGEFDTALYELERCWDELPGPPSPIGAGRRPATKRIISTLDDVHEAMDWYISHMPVELISAMATHISTDIDYSVVCDDEMSDALSRRENASQHERDIYASYINELFLTQLEERLASRVVFQFSFAAEPLPYETASRISQRTIAQLAQIISRHPKLRFQAFTASEQSNQSLCTLCRELPNLSLAGYWWHNFFPGTIRRVMEMRLDMLPVNKQIGFFSDAYCVEWAYGKAAMVRTQLAEVLAGKIEQGQYDVETAVEIARQTLYETTRVLLGGVSER